MNYYKQKENELKRHKERAKLHSRGLKIISEELYDIFLENEKNHIQLHIFLQLVLLSFIVFGSITIGMML